MYEFKSNQIIKFIKWINKIYKNDMIIWYFKQT